VRIGSFVRQFGGPEMVHVRIILYGSFALTYKGHRTDIAIVGGLIGMNYDDEDLINAFERAHEQNYSYEFEIDASDTYDANVAGFHLSFRDGRAMDIVCESVGGGMINVFMIDEMRVDISGDYPTIITMHKDTIGVVAKISALLAEHNVNIAFLKLYREAKHEKAILVAQTDEIIDDDILSHVRGIDEVLQAMCLIPIK
jgi:L-serine dehydratase